MGSRYQRPDKARLSVPASICRLQYLCWHAGAQTRKHKTQNNRNARISAAFLTLCTRFSKPWHAICKAEGQRAKVSLSTTSASCHPSPVLCISLISWRLSQNRRATSAKNGIRAPNTHTQSIHKSRHPSISRRCLGQARTTQHQQRATSPPWRRKGQQPSIRAT